MRQRDSALTDGLLSGMPKAALNIHIEGSLEPAEMMFEMAARNGVRLRAGASRGLRLRRPSVVLGPLSPCKRITASSPRSDLPDHARSYDAAPRGRAGSPSLCRCGGGGQTRHSSPKGSFCSPPV